MKSLLNCATRQHARLSDYILQRQDYTKCTNSNDIRHHRTRRLVKKFIVSPRESFPWPCVLLLFFSNCVRSILEGEKSLLSNLFEVAAHNVRSKPQQTSSLAYSFSSYLSDLRILNYSYSRVFSFYVYCKVCCEMWQLHALAPFKLRSHRKLLQSRKTLSLA